MAGMKYSPGFDDPSARPKLARTGRLLLAATLLGAGLTGAVLLFGPALTVDLGAALRAGAELLGLR
jgi:hypothetical protein